MSKCCQKIVFDIYFKRNISSKYFRKGTKMSKIVILKKIVTMPEEQFPKLEGAI